jgi:hypothetical protein
MIIKKNPILLLLLLILQINFLNAAQELDDFWKAWLEEVDPIMTEAERDRGGQKEISESLLAGPG